MSVKPPFTKGGGTHHRPTIPGREKTRLVGHCIYINDDKKKKKKDFQEQNGWGKPVDWAVLPLLEAPWPLWGDW